ncbi:response regulator transcription factor [Luteolibacter soli]|uniref:Response regulator n=1 Tax=Luteolibacter soli TaxID=3135280 RepID=A0ABU9AYF2_9BACT
MNGTTIHLVDDDAGLRKAISRLLWAEGYDVRAFASAAEFLDACHTGEIECLLLDVSMPDLDGLELQRRLVRSGATVPIVFLTGHGDIPMSVRAVKAGAVDFLTKPVDGYELLEAVRAALVQSGVDRNDREETSRIAGRFSRLTPREREVLEGVVAGKPNKIIAAELGTCEQTVKVHRGRVMEKMGAESLADLVRAADRIGALKKLAVCKAG